MDPFAAILFTLGIVALAISWILLLINSSREDFAWGLCSLVLPPLSYLYGLFRWRVAREPILLAILGWILIWLHTATG